ncbi:MAG: ModD protein [Arcobacteraceae bacterium]|nr:ModD protein [Arcobacteraceae bacterium]
MDVSRLIAEDIGFLDITTFGLGISTYKGVMEFSSKEECMVCGIKYVKEILTNLELEYSCFVEDGELVQENHLLITCFGDAGKLHKAWKVAQNILEFLCGIATYTYKISQKAKKINPNIEIATTRKTFPNTKEMMIDAVLCGGGIIHRMGLYDSILIFENHLEFLKDPNDLEKSFQTLKNKFSEKKIVVEIDNLFKANYFTSLGADILQCEKMNFQELEQCVFLKNKYPHLIISATGGISLENIEEYVKTGVDLIVTSSPYHAKPSDIKVKIKAMR